jgi:glycosyltransferase involved in cell wall biosynthesis
VDGLERNRKKWNRIAKRWYLLSEWLATWCCSAVVTDAERIREYYLDRYRKESNFIPYGAATGKLPGIGAVRELGLEPGRYALYVSRMEPENNALLVRQAFEQVKTDYKLALVGDAPYSASYIAEVRRTTDPRIVIPGAIYGDAYHQLQSHSAVYVQATEVGGTHPAMIEAMGRGAMVLYLRTPENEEVAGDAAVPFTDDLQHKLQWALDMSEQERATWGMRATKRVETRYSWEVVTCQYEHLFQQLTTE